MTASTHLAYEDQATGANNNTWGDVADENFRIFETAITETGVSISTTGGVTTLTTEQNRAPMFRVSGALASNATIRVRDTAKKFFLVKNNTSGAGFTVTISTASGTGVVIDRRRFYLLYSDGTNIIHARYGAVPYAEAAGTADAMTATCTPAFATGDLIDGVQLLIKPVGANTVTTPTLNVDGFGAVTINRFSGAALVAGDIAGVNHVMHLVYNATGPSWRLLNPYIADAARTDVANTFTANQTIRDTGAGAGVGPILTLDRDSASAAAADALGAIDFVGNDNAGSPVNVTYARIITGIDDPNSGVEDGNFGINTMTAGTLTRQITVKDGVYTAGATGSDKGIGTINATDFYQNGTRLFRPVFKTSDTTRTAVTVLSDPDLTFAVSANTKYSFRFYVWFDSPAADDFRFGINGPSTPTIFRVNYTYTDPPGSGHATGTLTAYETTGIDILYASGTNGGYLELNGIIQNGSNAGNVAFLWGKVLVGGNTMVRACSYVEYAVLA